MQLTSKPQNSDEGRRSEVPRPAKRDEKLTALTETRDQVKGRMSAAWDNPSPDMPALEALHYELKNLEYTIATHKPGGQS